MISFRHYIEESANILQSLEKLKQFKPHINVKFGEKLDVAINVLSKAYEDKHVFNARYGEATSSILNFINHVYNVLEKDTRDYQRENKDVDLPYSLYTVSDIKKAIKDTSKVKNLPDQIKKFFDVIKDIPEIFAIVKGYVQKGKAPKEPKPGQFIKPPASFNASKVAINFMKEAASSFEKNLRNNIENQIITAYNKIKGFEKLADIPKDPTSKTVATTIFTTKYKDGEKMLSLMPNADERVKLLIDNNVRDIVEGFVSKSASKLALILDKKGQPKEHEIIRTNINNGMVENAMKFVFEDGSSFTLESSVVYKYSQMGKLFFQYPTRFKNVRNADGTMMKMPSEKKMIEEF
jgi:hypothetical protein